MTTNGSLVTPVSWLLPAIHPSFPSNIIQHPSFSNMISQEKVTFIQRVKPTYLLHLPLTTTTNYPFKHHQDQFPLPTHSIIKAIQVQRWSIFNASDENSKIDHLLFLLNLFHVLHSYHYDHTEPASSPSWLLNSYCQLKTPVRDKNPISISVQIERPLFQPVTTHD
jgi:hypothetical protein